MFLWSVIHCLTPGPRATANLKWNVRKSTDCCAAGQDEACGLLRGWMCIPFLVYRGPRLRNCVILSHRLRLRLGCLCARACSCCSPPPTSLSALPVTFYIICICSLLFSTEMCMSLRTWISRPDSSMQPNALLQSRPAKEEASPRHPSAFCSSDQRLAQCSCEAHCEQ